MGGEGPLRVHPLLNILSFQGESLNGIPYSSIKVFLCQTLMFLEGPPPNLKEIKAEMMRTEHSPAPKEGQNVGGIPHTSLSPTSL